MKVLSFGSLNLDYTYRVEHFVRPGETVSSLSRSVNCGGKGLNQSLALARAGAQVWHAGAVGASDGGMLCRALAESGVNTDYVVRREDVPSGHAVIQVDAAGQNCILLCGGANRTITPAQVDETLTHFAAGDLLVLQNEISQLAYIIARGREKGMVIALNPSPMDAGIAALPLEAVDIFLLNEGEAADLCGGQGSLEELTRRFPKAGIVLTLGEKGALYRQGDRTFSHGIYRVPVVDTTAAGDTFTGYFLAALTRGCGAEEALDQASAAAALAVSRPGAGASIPTLAEVLASHLPPETR